MKQPSLYRCLPPIGRYDEAFDRGAYPEHRHLANRWADLVRERPATVEAQCTFFESVPEKDAVELARSLRDLDARALKAERLRAALEDSSDLAEGFMVAAAAI